MAKAERTVVQVPVTTMRSEEQVTLTLNMNEATFLKDIMARIGGCPDTSRRRHEQAINLALQEAGIKRSGLDDVEFGKQSIHFKKEI